jgi:hypothetical protein
VSRLVKLDVALWSSTLWKAPEMFPKFPRPNPHLTLSSWHGDPSLRPSWFKSSDELPSPSVTGACLFGPVPSGCRELTVPEPQTLAESTYSLPDLTSPVSSRLLVTRFHHSSWSTLTATFSALTLTFPSSLSLLGDYCQRQNHLHPKTFSTL